MISEKGIENTTIKDIAEAAGVAVGTFYIYFDSKKDIVNRLDRTQYQELLLNAKSLKNCSCIQKISNYFRQWHELGETYEPGLIREWHKLAIDPKHNYASKITLEISYIEELLNDGIKNGELKNDTPFREIALLFAFELWGSSIYWCMFDGKPSRKNLAENFISYIVEPVLEKYIA